MESVDSSNTRPKKITANILSVFLLIGILVATIWTVRKFIKPGQMGIIESQSMDMTVMQAPEGSVPVSVSTVKRKNFQVKTPSYGTVLAYNEIDIFPRVTGRIVRMSVYPGEKVSKGQILAELDTSELASKTDEALWGERLSLSEKKVVSQKQKSLAFERKSAKNEYDAAGAALKESVAELAYWKEEYDRESKLYGNGAISKDEFQMTESKYKSAAAREEASKNRQEAAYNRIISLKYNESATEEELRKQNAAVMQARAILKTAQLVQGYTRIEAPYSAYVTARLAAPGTLVTLGMPILRLADMRNVRIQAVLSEKDISSVRKGNIIEYKLPYTAEKWHKAVITSVFPSVDAGARTGIVEAVVFNTGKRLIPGAYIHVRVSTAEVPSALVVPSDAVVQNTDSQNRMGVWLVKDEGKGKISLYTCSMHPEIISNKPGNCTKCGMNLIPKKSSGGLHVYFKPVVAGISDGTETQIKTGLKEGDTIAVKGIQDLQNGYAISPVDWEADGPELLPVSPSVSPDAHKGHSGSSPNAMPSMNPMPEDADNGHRNASGQSMPGMPDTQIPSQRSSVSPENLKTTISQEKPAAVKSFTCPMHPEVVSNKQGYCPKCDMKLVLK